MPQSPDKPVVIGLFSETVRLAGQRQTTLILQDVLANTQNTTIQTSLMGVLAERSESLNNAIGDMATAYAVPYTAIRTEVINTAKALHIANPGGKKSSPLIKFGGNA